MFLEQQINIKIISEGLCDTEDRSYENSALITGINYIKMYSNRKQLF